jgi:hypothetical protein
MPLLTGFKMAGFTRMHGWVVAASILEIFCALAKTLPIVTKCGLLNRRPKKVSFD